MHVDDIKLAGKKRNINPTWKVRMEDVDLGEPTSFLDHLYLGCTQNENVRLARILWRITKVCLNLGFLLVLWKDYEMPKLHGNLSQTLSLHGPVTWKVMRSKVQRVVLRGDIVKDDSGSYAVFTCSSASQMTAAKVMDVIARQAGCAGQAATQICLHPSPNGGRSQIAQNSKVRVS